MAPPRPTLYRLACERRYNDLLRELKVCEEKNDFNDACWSNQYGQTVLHRLCDQVKTVQRMDYSLLLLDCIRIIVRHVPSLVAQHNHSSLTPLHLCCEPLQWQKKSAQYDYYTEIILCLLEACPYAVSEQTNVGFSQETPFHVACKAGAPLSVLRAMLQIDPALASMPHNKKDEYTRSDNPLQTVWMATTRHQNNYNSYSNNDHIQQNQNKNNIHDVRYERMELLLRAAYCGTVDDDDDNNNNGGDSLFNLLAAACSIRCPREYITNILKLHADKVRQPDNRDWIPLHYAVYSATKDALSYTEFLLESLLDLYPEGASVPIPYTDKHGDSNNPPPPLLPLHVLLTADTKCTWESGGLKQLVKAYPEALTVPDPRSGLVPVLQSATSATHSRLQLSVTFELLLKEPDISKYLFCTTF